MGREGKRDGEKHYCVVASSMLPIGGLAHNPGMCPDWELNWPPFGLQAGTQATEPYQPGQNPIVSSSGGRSHVVQPPNQNLL